MSVYHTRRNFLISTGGVLGAGLFPHQYPLSRKAAESTGRVDLAVVHGDTALAAARAVELLGGMDRFVHAGIPFS